MKHKGQLNIEFIVDVAIFSSIVLAVVTLTISNIPRTYRIHNENYVKSRMYEISELLLFDKGSPENWGDLSNLNDVKRFGLSTGENYYLNMTKINKLLDFCNHNYTGILSKFNITDRDIFIMFKNSTGTIGICGKYNYYNYSAIKRFGIYNNGNENETIEIEVGVY